MLSRALFVTTTRILSPLLLAACGAGDVAPPPLLAAENPQTPPTAAAPLEAWLHTGAYKRWHCEATVHGAPSPSVHGIARICANDALASAVDGDAAWPAGAAAVAELYARATDAAPAGFAVAVKTQADSAGGAGWYWYARVPLAEAVLPHDAHGLAADGTGEAVPQLGACVQCHRSAGSDPAHTPRALGRDLVFTPVR